ncbi:hypothetical protein K491DRAFT_212551 [Lophiostoma macrostomum CBS 122681]|uniref:F-box domain-containing protein n=1 Tax=Lophiostoma macrostomum CBS 122681 TaxID=1314788 RepID=A0A6A6SRN2_9PLEO|nr:hypothetical protein K491DRAFT_212551 [Lophiostoma macrostomum CBS 122681]
MFKPHFPHFLTQPALSFSTVPAFDHRAASHYQYGQRSDQMASASSTPPLLRLPNELLDIIVELAYPSGIVGRDWNSHRQRNLLPLARTCRRLRPVAEHGMYQIITTHNLRKMKGEYVRSRTFLPSLFQTLNSRRDLGEQVRMLHLFAIDGRINYVRRDPSDPITSDGGCRTISELRLVGHLLKLLSNLSTLKIQILGMDKGIYLQDPLLKLFGELKYKDMLRSRSMAPYLQNLETLEHGGGELHWLFWTLPKLQRLNFNHRVRFKHDVMYMSSPGQIKEVETVHSTAILTKLSVSLNHETRRFFHGCQNLRRLTIMFVDTIYFNPQASIDNFVRLHNKGSYEALNDMLQHCRTTLKTLSVDYKDFYLSFCPRISVVRLSPIGPLCTFTALKILKLPQAALLGSDGYMHRHPIPIKQLLPPNIEHLGLLQPTPSIEPWLKELARYSHHFKQLKTVTLRFCTDSQHLSFLGGTSLGDRLLDGGIQVKCEFFSLDSLEEDRLGV